MNKRGRKKVEITEHYIAVWNDWKNGKYKTTVEAIKDSGFPKSTFYKFNSILEKTNS